jgi:hydroxymethylbilane synthase
VRKLLQSDVDGLIVAKAALDRLLAAPAVSADDFSATKNELREALSQCRFMVTPLRENPSAPAQGALAIEISRRREDLRQLIAPVNCADTFSAVQRERAILRSHGGGCHQKIGASVLRRSFGEVTFLRGLTDSAEALNSCALEPAVSRPTKLKAEQLWPVEKSPDLFTRERIPLAAPAESTALWIAKAEALPDDWRLGKDRVIWTSGVQTWKRLARRGVWVNGCAESLGEHEPARIETLTGGPLKWLKLTHEGGAEGEMPIAATYRLRPRTDEFGLDGKRYFFWKSGSSFERALQLNPSIKEMVHFCGPGNTQRILEQHGIRPHIFLDHAQWLEEMGQDVGRGTG